MTIINSLYAYEASVEGGESTRVMGRKQFEDIHVI